MVLQNSSNKIERGSCQGYVFAASFGLLQRQASLGVNFRTPPTAETKLQKFPYVLLKHNLATHASIKYISVIVKYYTDGREVRHTIRTKLTEH